MRRRILPLLLVILGVLASGEAAAGPRDFIVCISGFPGTTEQAAPTLARLHRHLEKMLGWPEKALDGAYYPDPEEGLKQIKARNPGFAVVTHQMYADQGKAMKMQVIGAMELANGSLRRFHVVARTQGGPTKLEELRGRKLASQYLSEPRFVSKVILAGALDVSTDVQGIKTTTPLAALRQVDRGQADAALIDEPALQSMSKLPFGKNLRVIFSSADVPPPPIVALPAASAADRRALSKILPQLCEGTDGAELCRSFELSRVVPATAKTYAPLVKQMSR